MEKKPWKDDFLINVEAKFKMITWSIYPNETMAIGKNWAPWYGEENN